MDTFQNDHRETEFEEQPVPVYPAREQPEPQELTGQEPPAAQELEAVPGACDAPQDTPAFRQEPPAGGCYVHPQSAAEPYTPPQSASEPYRYVPHGESEPYRYVPHGESEPYRRAPQSPSEPYRYVPQNEQPPVRKKSSPYENSPYVMDRRPREQDYRYQPQTQPQSKAPRVKGEKKQRKPIWRSLLSAVLVVALVVCGCLVTAEGVSREMEQRNQESINALNQRIADLEQQIQNIPAPTDSGDSVSGSPAAAGGGMTPAQVYAQNVRSVVAISVTLQSTVYGQSVDGTAAGSGFILTEDGYVVTNYHVVEGATAVSVIMSDDTELSAAVVGYDSANDVAVLKVEATGLPAVTLGSSGDLIVGDMVVAIGNPLGELNATQTVGYICGKDREVTTGGTIINMLQTDAAINPGNSGGPLFNMKGEVVGITTAKYSGTTSSGASIEGIGFAIPIDDIQGIIGDLKTYGYVTGAYLGVTVQNVDSGVTDTYGFSGAVVISVEKGYAADRAGIKPKDIIIGLNGQTIGSITDLTRGLRSYDAGDTVTLTLIRGGVKMDVSVTLDEKPQNFQSTVPQPSEGEMPSEGDFDEWYDYFRRYFGD